VFFFISPEGKSVTPRFKALKALVGWRFREFCREPSANVWVVVMPLLWMIVLGFAFHNPKPESYGLCVNQGMIGEVWFDALMNDPQIRLLIPGSELESNRALKKGQCNIVVAFSEGGSLVFHRDTSDPLTSRAKLYVEDKIQRAMGRSDKIEVQEQAISVIGLRYIDFLVPGLLALSLMSSSLFGVGMTIVSNRKESLLKRLLLTPMVPFDYLLSHVIGRVFVFVVEFLAILIAAKLIFAFTVQGSLLFYFIFALGIAMVFSAMALALASRTQSIPYMAGLINLILVPSILLGGIFFSRNNFPVFIQGLLDYLPLSLAVDLLRGVASSFLDASEIFAKATCLALYGAISLAYAWRRFKWF
jgi:ABC-2 type transport system permease protein